MKLVLATNNPGKVKEFARILEPLGIEVITQKQAGADLHVEENGETFAENARLKAMAVYRATGLPTVADDSGLCVDALDGKPGVYSARWYGEDTPYAEKNARLIAELEDVPQEKRTARFVAHITCVLSETEVLDCEGICEGWIGYDPILMLPEYGKTSAEITMEEKNAISHRGKALEKLYQELKQIKDNQR